MKIRIKEPKLYTWDEIDVEKSEKNFSKEEFDYECKPLVLKNFKVGLNSCGQLVIEFGSENHKYFKVGCNTGWCSWDDNQVVDEAPSEFGSRTIFLESHTKVWDKELEFLSSLWRTELVITPETKEEDKLIEGTVSALPLKWQYALTFLSWEDYDVETLDSENCDEEFMLGDHVYKYDLKL